MKWLNQDWEHEAIKDESYLMEEKFQIELEYQQWKEENDAKYRLPAIIKVIKPKIKYETEHKSYTI